MRGLRVPTFAGRVQEPAELCVRVRDGWGLNLVRVERYKGVEQLCQPKSAIWKNFGPESDQESKILEQERSRSLEMWLRPLLLCLHLRYEHQRWARIRTGSDWSPDWRQFWPDQDWIGLQFFWKLADQDWIGLRKFLMFLCDYSEHIKTFSCDPILQIC